MKETIRRDAIAPYKEITKRSPLPFLMAGLAFVLFGAMRPVYRLWDYAVMAGVALIAFYIARGIWRDQKVRVELPPDTGDMQADQLLAQAREALVSFRTNSERIRVPKISACVEGIESVGGQILRRLEEQPALHSQLRAFLRYYIPTTQKLLDARVSILEEGHLSENERVVVERTDRVLPEIQKAFERQLEALDKHKYLDLQVEMDVLEGMLKSDGLMDARRS